MADGSVGLWSRGGGHPTRRPNHDHRAPVLAERSDAGTHPLTFLAGSHALRAYCPYTVYMGHPRGF